MMRLLLAAWLALGLAAGVSAARAAPPAPFEFVQDRQILLPIRVNGHPAEAWLDSGASATVMDAAFARSIGLELHGEVRAEGVAGQVHGARLVQLDLDVGDLKLKGRISAVMDLSAVTRVVQRPVEVILGRDIFEHAIVDIDFRSRRIAFLPREGFQPPAGEPLPLTLSGNLRSIPITVGALATPAILDLGNAGGLMLDRSFAERWGLLDGRKLSTQLSVGADGPREAAITSLDRVGLGGVVFNGVPTLATEGLVSKAPANVGLQLLSRFHLTIDFDGGRIWMQPYRDAAQAPFRRNRAGLSVLPEPGRLVVSHVAAGSPAALSGWRVGEVIVAVDGRPVGDSYLASPLSWWMNWPAGRLVRLTLGDGRRRAIRLADYY